MQTPRRKGATGRRMRGPYWDLLSSISSKYLMDIPIDPLPRHLGTLAHPKALPENFAV